MPKTKKQSKLKRTLNWLKPNTLLKKLILVMVIVGAVGGGYNVYKSRAASLTQYPSDFNSNNVNTSLSTDCNGNKGCISVAKISAGGTVVAIFHTNFAQQTPVFVCAMARGQVSAGKISPDMTMVDRSPAGSVFYGAGTNSFFAFPQGTTYHEYCKAIGINPGARTVYIAIGQGIGGNTSQLYVASATMKW